LNHVVKADSGTTAQTKSLAVEVAVPRGPVASYGLFGGIYEQSPDEC
jgi:hypothetical protein